MKKTILILYNQMKMDFEQREKIVAGHKTDQNQKIIRIQETLSIKEVDNMKAPKRSVIQYALFYMSTIKASIHNKKMVKILIGIIIMFFLVLIFFFLSALSLSYVYSQSIQHQHLYHFSKYYQTFEQYLRRIEVKSFLNINCNLQCFLKQNDQFLQQINVTYVQSLPIFEDNEDQFVFYGWINYHNLNFGSMDDEQINIYANKLKMMSKEGVSLTWDLQIFRKFGNSQFQRLIKAFHKSNLFINPALTLKIRRFQSRPIEIFTSMGQGVNNLDPQNPPYHLAIQAEIKLVDDFSYMPQWIQYNMINGVDYFFLYEVSSDSHIDCQNIKQKDFLLEWERFLAVYQNNIIFIPWNKQSQEQISAKNDYVYHYGNLIEYTIFLKTNQIIFSVLGLKLSNLLISKKESSFTSLTLEKKLFVDRMCHFSNSYMVENYAYYEMPDKYRESIEVIKTEQFNPRFHWLSTYGKSVYRFNEKHMRINSYTGNQQKIRKVVGIGANLYLSYDYSAQSRIKIAKVSCIQNCKIMQMYQCNKKDISTCPKQFQKVQKNPYIELSNKNKESNVL